MNSAGFEQTSTGGCLCGIPEGILITPLWSAHQEQKVSNWVPAGGRDGHWDLKKYIWAACVSRQSLYATG